MPEELTAGSPRILLVKLSSFGDVLHALPALEALRAAFPRGHITWLVEAGYAALLEGHPALNEVWTVPSLHLNRGRATKDLRDIARLLHRLRDRPFDLVIDLHGLMKSALWVALSRSPRKVGYDRSREGSFLALTERVAPFDPEAHAVWRWLNLAHYLGAPPALPRFRLGLSASFDRARLIPGDGFPKMVVLHPRARWPSKLWVPESWAHLADWLSRTHGLKVILTGSAADRELAAQITAQMEEEAVNLVGRTSLGELAGILEQACLAVTTDTGPMHLAAALGTRVVALFGPTAPWRTGPFGVGHEIVRLGLDCSPCFKRHCPEPRCLTDLPLEAVQAACEKILSRAEIS